MLATLVGLSMLLTVLGGTVTLAGVLLSRRLRARQARRHPQQAAARNQTRRARRLAAEWPLLAQTLGLGYRDQWTRQHRYPAAELQVDDQGVTANVAAIAGAGLADYQHAAGYLADIWGCVSVRAEQQAPGLIRLRGLHHDPLLAPARIDLPGTAPASRSSWWLGWSEDGSAVMIRLAEVSGIVVAGLAGFGKTMLVAHQLGQLAPSPAAVRNIHNILHRGLKDAMRWGYVVRNVADAADPPKGKSAEMRVWTPEQLRVFLDHVREDDLYAAWLLITTTGMRRGELAGLRWVDVDLEAARLSIRQPRVVVANAPQTSEPKTARGRRALALDPVTVAALRRHRARQLEHKLAVGARYLESGLVFTWLDGSPIHPLRFSRWFEQHARRAGLPKIRLHDLRHSYASAALAAGVPAKVISERLGHTTIAVTMDIYSHVLPGLDREAADTVARLILGGGSAVSETSVNKPLASGRDGGDGKDR